MEHNLVIELVVTAAQSTWAALSISFTWFTSHVWPVIWEYVILGILYKAIFAHWAADMIMKWSKKRLIQTRGQMALWIHYRDRAMGRGHEPEPDVCMDGLCGEVNRLKKLSV